jgi:hypothetical protein
MDQGIETSLSSLYRPGTIEAFAKDTLERPDHFFRRFFSLPSVFPAGFAIPVANPWKRQRRPHPHDRTAFLKPIFRHTKLLEPKNFGQISPAHSLSGFKKSFFTEYRLPYLGYRYPKIATTIIPPAVKFVKGSPELIF